MTGPASTIAMLSIPVGHVAGAPVEELVVPLMSAGGALAAAARLLAARLTDRHRGHESEPKPEPEPKPKPERTNTPRPAGQR